MRCVGLVALMLLSIGMVQALEFEPDCTYSSLPPMAGWNESFDFSDIQDYCLYNDSVFHVRSPVFTNRLGEPFTRAPSDLFRNDFLLQEQGNVRNVLVRVEYYAPSYQGVCLANSINGVTGLFNSPMWVLLANTQEGFGVESTFDDSFINVNGQITCDEWVTGEVLVRDFTNDFGSSFSGQSKTIGTFGFEVTNVYIRNVELVGSGGTIDLW